MYTTEHAVAFLLGTGTDAKGRTVEDYLQFDADKWEECHDHIQWAFPSHIASDFNPNAPIVDSMELACAIADFKVIRTNLDKLIEAYFNSIGISITDDVYGNATLKLLDDENSHLLDWLFSDNDHNHRRISRLLNLMRLVSTHGTHVSAKTFYSFLLDTLAKKPHNRLDQRSVLFWGKAFLGEL